MTATNFVNANLNGSIETGRLLKARESQLPNLFVAAFSGFHYICRRPHCQHKTRPPQRSMNAQRRISIVARSCASSSAFRRAAAPMFIRV